MVSFCELLQVTTLYSHVWGPSPYAPNASIARTGITKINATDTLDLLKSIRVTGGSGPAEQLTAFLNFSMFLLGDVGHNCINLTADRMLVEYVIPSQSSSLLDQLHKLPAHQQNQCVALCEQVIP